MKHGIKDESYLARVQQAVMAVANRVHSEDHVPGKILRMLAAIPSEKEFEQVLRTITTLSDEKEFANYTHADILEAAMQKDPRAFLRGEDLDDDTPATGQKPSAAKKQKPALEKPAAAAGSHSPAVSPERNAMLRHAFLESAGITDEGPYTDLSIRDCIRQVLDSAGITLKKIGPSKHLAFGRIKGATRQPKWARHLGESLFPLLDSASKEGRIIRSSATPAPEWETKQEIASRHINTLLVSDFCRAAGIENNVPVPDLTSFMHSYFEVVNKYAGIGYDKLGRNFSPPVNKDYISQRLLGQTNYNGNFVSQLGFALRPFLTQGFQEGVLDEARMPKTYERILCEQLEIPYGFLEGKKGLDALLHCIDKSGLTRSVASAIIGHNHKVFTDTTLKLADVVHIAHGIKPYLRGKSWNGVLEVTEPNFLKAHLTARTYVLRKVQALLPSPMAAELEDILEGLKTSAPSLSDTLGPTLKLLREHVNLFQRSFGQSLTQSELARYESNCFNPNILDANGELNETTRKRMDRFAEVVAEKWKSKDAAVFTWAAREDARPVAAAQRH